MSIITQNNDGRKPLQARARDCANNILTEVCRYAPEDQSTALQQLLTDWLSTTNDALLREMVLAEVARRLRVPPVTLRELVATASESSPVGCHPYRGLTVTTETEGVSRFVDLATVQPKDVDWLADRLLARGKITLLDAPPGAAKTSFAVAMTHALSTGTRFIGLDTVQSKSVWLQFEMSAEDLALKYELLGGLPQGAVFIDREPVPLRESYTRLVNAVLAQSVDVVVADLLYDWLNLEDYCDIAQARSAMQLLRQFVNDTGCAVLGIRHVFKGASLQTPHAGAGSHIFAGKADFCITIEADTEQSDFATLRAVKARYGNLRGWSMSLRLKDGRFLPVEQPQEQPLHQQVTDYVASTGRRVPKQEILDRFNAHSEPTLRRALEKAVRFGLLQTEYERTGRAHRALYWVPNSVVTVTALYGRQATTEPEDPFALPADGLWACDPRTGHWYRKPAVEGGGEQ